VARGGTTVKNRLRGLAGLPGDQEPEVERTALTREQVVRAALELLDDVGLEGLSMRSLADRLGVRAASLYWHLRDKDQLLDLLAEAILAEVPEPAGGPWRAELEGFAAGFRQVLLAHRDAARIVGGLQVGPSALRRYDGLLARLLAAGFASADAADAAVLLFAHYVPAFVADEAGAAPPPDAGPRGDFGAPLEGVESGTLEIGGGASQLTVRADPELRELYAGHFEGRAPRIEAADGVVRIGGLGHGRRHAGQLVLTAGIPWAVAVAGGARRLSMDLRAAHLRSLALNGGASDVTVQLGRPSGTVTIVVSGGASRMSLHRPPGSAIRVLVAGGVSRLVLDDLQFGAVGGETRWQTPDFAAAEDRYDVELRGGASRLTIDAAVEAAPDGAPPEGAAVDAPDPLRGLSTAGLPSLAAAAGRIVDPDADARFRSGLRLVLDGLDRRLAGA
jgi:AcrR family transcriptional regulator